MTDDRPSIDPSDEELVSAYLDGEATADERARVEADPALLAEVEAFRAVAAAVGGPVLPPDRHRGDRMIAAALAAAEPRSDRSDSADPPEQPARPEHRDRSADADVVPIGRRRSRWLTRAPGLAAAAAVLFLIGIGLVVTARDTGPDQSAGRQTARETETRSATGDGAGSSEDRSEEQDELSSEAAPRAATPPAADLGGFPDEAALREALGTQALDAGPEAGSPSAEGGSDAAGDDDARFRTEADRCATVVTTTDTALDELLTVRTASIDGVPVLVFSHRERDEPGRIIDTVVDRGSCQILFAQAR